MPHNSLPVYFLIEQVLSIPISFSSHQAGQRITTITGHMNHWVGSPKTKESQPLFGLRSASVTPSLHSAQTEELQKIKQLSTSEAY